MVGSLCRRQVVFIFQFRSTVMNVAHSANCLIVINAGIFNYMSYGPLERFTLCFETLKPQAGLSLY